MNQSKVSEVEEVEKGLFEGLIEALGDKHSQLDLNFRKAAVSLLGTGLGLELNGLVTLTVHMRDLTEDEMKASATKNVALMASK